MAVVADDIAADASAAPRRLPLRTNFAWTLAGNVVYAGCQWGMLVALAKLGTPEKVGQFALGLAVTAPVVMFSQMQLRAVQATDAKCEYQFGDYLALRLLTTALALLVIAGIVAIAGYSRDTGAVILAVGLAKSFESIGDILYGLLQHHERMARIAQSMMLKGPLSLLALGGGVWLTGSVFWGSLGLAAAWLIVLLTFDIHSGRCLLGSWRALSPRWDVQCQRRLTLIALPLGFVTLLFSLTNNAPRYFVQSAAGEKALGLFAATAYFTMAGGTLMTALCQCVSPRLASDFANCHFERYRATILKVMLCGATLGITGFLSACVWGSWLLTRFYGPEYQHATDTLIWTTLGGAVLYVAWPLSYAMTAARRITAQIPLYILILLVATATGALLIPPFGIVGAAWSILITNVVQLAASSYIALDRGLNRIKNHDHSPDGRSPRSARARSHLLG
jgi:O-antigen/teichoic acid export membrane protein